MSSRLNTPGELSTFHPCSIWLQHLKIRDSYLACENAGCRFHPPTLQAVREHWCGQGSLPLHPDYLWTEPEFNAAFRVSEPAPANLPSFELNAKGNLVSADVLAELDVLKFECDTMQTGIFQWTLNAGQRDRFSGAVEALIIKGDRYAGAVEVLKTLGLHAGLEISRVDGKTVWREVEP
jgi:hypothetical protein